MFTKQKSEKVFEVSVNVNIKLNEFGELGMFFSKDICNNFSWNYSLVGEYAREAFNSFWRKEL